MGFSRSATLITLLCFRYVHVMFSRIVPSNNKQSCGTIPICCLTLLMLTLLISKLSMYSSAFGSYNLGSSFISVLFSATTLANYSYETAFFYVQLTLSICISPWLLNRNSRFSNCIFLDWRMKLFRLLLLLPVLGQNNASLSIDIATCWNPCKA